MAVDEINSCVSFKQILIIVFALRSLRLRFEFETHVLNEKKENWKLFPYSFKLCKPGREFRNVLSRRRATVEFKTIFYITN